MAIIDNSDLLTPKEKQMVLELLDHQISCYKCDENLLKTIREVLCDSINIIKRKLMHYPIYIRKISSLSSQETYKNYKEKQTRDKIRENRTKIIENGEIIH